MNELSERWVCVGQRIGDGNKIFYGWVLESAPKDAVIYFGKLKGWPGEIREVKVERPKEGLITASLGKHVGRFEDKELNAEWQAAHDAARVQHATKSREKKDKNEGGYEKLLRPLSTAYAHADPIGREIILAKAIHAIIRPYR